VSGGYNVISECCTSFDRDDACSNEDSAFAKLAFSD